MMDEFPAVMLATGFGDGQLWGNEFVRIFLWYFARLG